MSRESYKLVKTSAIPQITEVRVYEETISHVETEHPEVPINLPSVFAGMVGAIESPTHIEEGNRDGTFVYVDNNSTNASGDPFRVPVKVVDGTSALMKTAFFATPEKPPRVVWRKK